MDDVSSGNDFYEDDEPIQDVLAAFGPGPHPVTQRPLPAGGVIVTAFDSFAAGPILRPHVGGFQITHPQTPSLTGV